MGTREPARHRRGALVRRERSLAASASRQHGVLSRGQLLAAGLSARTLRRRVEAGRLFPLHREVFALGHGRVTRSGELLAAVLACGEGALLSHRSAAELWGLAHFKRTTAEVTALRGKHRMGVVVHEAGVHVEERTIVDAIPITTVARTLLDLAEIVDERTLGVAFEQAERLRRLDLGALEAVLARGYGRRGLKPLRRLAENAGGPATRSPLEDRVVALCVEHGLPLPETNAIVLGREVDALWPDRKLMVEADSFEFHGHREAFERDRARDAAMQVAGYRVVRLTHRRLDREPVRVAAELRRLLAGGRAGS